MVELLIEVLVTDEGWISKYELSFEYNIVNIAMNSSTFFVTENILKYFAAN